MKRLFLILFSLVLVSSCLDDGSGAGQSITAYATFSYPNMTFRSDSTFFNDGKTPQGFGYDILNFYHQLDADKKNVLGGFRLSCLKMPVSGNTADLQNNTFRCYLKNHKRQYENIYTVYYQNPEVSYMPSHSIEFPYSKNGTCVLLEMLVTNTVEVADSIKAHFKVGDRLTLKAKGYLAGNKTGEVEFPLADYSAAKDSIVSTWTAVNLQKLGAIDFVDLEVISTNPSVPTYFCMDNLEYQAELLY